MQRGSDGNGHDSSFFELTAALARFQFGDMLIPESANFSGVIAKVLPDEMSSSMQYFSWG